MMRFAKITQTLSEEDWFNSYVKVALAQRVELPPQKWSLGPTQINWFETEPGIAFIRTVGGNVADRTLAETVTRERLREHGIEQAKYTFYWDKGHPLTKLAEWEDVQAKAARLIQNNAVKIDRNGYTNIIGQVTGDHGRYQTEISREDPNSPAVTQWQCQCPWDQFAWQRTRQWKKYEGRPCAHVLATYWLSQVTPLDEDAHPANQPGQQTMFGPGAPPSAGGIWAQPRGAPAPAIPSGPNQMPGAPSQQMMIPGMMPGFATGTPPLPADPGVIPPFPNAPPDPALMPNPASVPGLKQPSPTNPMQYPGGTFSRVAAAFNNGEMVSTRLRDWGEWQGRSEEHGAGQPVEIPMNAVGEVLGQDPTTGMVNVLFMGGSLGVQEHGQMMPWGATAWYFPSQLNRRTDVQAPGPAVKRTRG